MTRPVMCDCRDDRRLQYIRSSSNTWSCQNLAAEQLLPEQAVWTVHHTAQITPSGPLSSKLDCAERRVRQAFNGRRVGLRGSKGAEHGLINYVGTKAKCRHLKN
jgi:hypothetical protein